MLCFNGLFFHFLNSEKFFHVQTPSEASAGQPETVRGWRRRRLLSRAAPVVSEPRSVPALPAYLARTLWCPPVQVSLSGHHLLDICHHFGKKRVQPLDLTCGGSAHFVLQQ